MPVKTRVQMLGRKGSRFWAGISNWLFSYNIVAKISPKFLFRCSMTSFVVFWGFLLIWGFLAVLIFLI